MSEEIKKEVSETKAEPKKAAVKKEVQKTEPSTLNKPALADMVKSARETYRKAMEAKLAAQAKK